MFNRRCGARVAGSVLAFVIGAVASEGCAARHVSSAAAVPPAPAQAQSGEAVTPAVPPPASPLPKAAVRTAEMSDPALREALLALAQQPSSASLRRVANEYRRLRILDMAIARFNEALRLDRRDAASYDGRARTLRDSGFPGLGLSDAHRAVFFAPTSAIAANTLGTLLEAVGRLSEAKRQYVRALTLDPAATFAHTNLCHVQTRLGEGGAVATCRARLARSPDSVGAHNNLALAYAVAGDFGLAQEAFAAAAAPANAAYNMGIVYMAARRLDLADDAFRAASLSGLEPGAAATRLRQISAMRGE